MKLDELKTAWREEMEATSPLFNFKLTQIAKEINKIERENLLGTTVMCIMTVVLASSFIAISRIVELGWFQILNFIVITAWLACGTYRFYRAGKSRVDDNWTLVARLSRGKELLNKQKNYVRNIALKWVLPMLAWCTLVLYGSYIVKTGDYLPPIKYLIITGVILVLVMLGGKLASVISKDKYETLLRQLNQLEEQIKDE